MSPEVRIWATKLKSMEMTIFMEVSRPRTAVGLAVVSGPKTKTFRMRVLEDNARSDKRNQHHI